MNLLGVIVCYFRGHKRGKESPGPDGKFEVGFNYFACPRCGRLKKYKFKPTPEKPRGTPADGSPHFQETA